MHTQQRESGAALFISLIMLLLMTIIAITATRSSTLELLMGTNTQHAAQAFMLAEDSAISGEYRIENDLPGAPNGSYFSDENDGIYIHTDVDVDDINWEDVVYEVTGADEGDDASDRREYIIEYIGPIPASGSSEALGLGAQYTRYVYRVSGRGTADRSSARVIQTIYATID